MLSSGSGDQLWTPPVILFWSWVFALLVFWGPVSLPQDLWGKVSDLLSVCCDALLIIFQFCSVL
jgi:hypothetical protein